MVGFYSVVMCLGQANADTHSTVRPSHGGWVAESIGLHMALQEGAVTTLLIMVEFDAARNGRLSLTLHKSDSTASITGRSYYARV